jgi:hypothetical protein
LTNRVESEKLSTLFMLPISLHTLIPEAMPLGGLSGITPNFFIALYSPGEEIFWGRNNLL